VSTLYEGRGRGGTAARAARKAVGGGEAPRVQGAQVRKGAAREGWDGAPGPGARGSASARGGAAALGASPPPPRRPPPPRPRASPAAPRGPPAPPPPAPPARETRPPLGLTGSPLDRLGRAGADLLLKLLEGADAAALVLERRLYLVCARLRRREPLPQHLGRGDVRLIPPPQNTGSRFRNPLMATIRDACVCTKGTSGRALPGKARTSSALSPSPPPPPASPSEGARPSGAGASGAGAARARQGRRASAAAPSLSEPDAALGTLASAVRSCCLVRLRTAQRVRSSGAPA
jgi:hypothetical protein